MPAIQTTFDDKAKSKSRLMIGAFESPASLRVGSADAIIRKRK
jgi:hypothetical protein